jgi:TonB family protein
MLFIALPLLGQSKCDSIIPFSHPEKELPIFDKSAKNDFEKLYEFLMENLNYPETAKADKVEGQVFVQFEIDINGFTIDHRIIQSIRQDLDDEALRVAKLIKYDVPAKNYYDEPIGMCFTLPIRFKLDAEKKQLRKSKSKTGKTM